MRYVRVCILDHGSNRYVNRTTGRSPSLTGVGRANVVKTGKLASSVSIEVGLQEDGSPESTGFSPSVARMGGLTELGLRTVGPLDTAVQRPLCIAVTNGYRRPDLVTCGPQTSVDLTNGCILHVGGSGIYKLLPGRLVLDPCLDSRL